MKGELIGAFHNKWRQRRVRIFADTSDPEMVYTEGVSTVIAPGDHEDGAIVETHESRQLFARYIGSFNKVYE